MSKAASCKITDLPQTGNRDREDRISHPSGSSCIPRERGLRAYQARNAPISNIESFTHPDHPVCPCSTEWKLRA